jgi:WD40 repeat protein
VKLWNYHQNSDYEILKHNKVERVIWNPARDLLASVGDGTINIWDSKQVSIIQSWRAAESNWIQWSPDGRYISSGNWEYTKKQIKIWDAITGEVVSVAPPGSRVNWSPDCRFLAIANHNTVNIWNIETKETVHVLSGHTREGGKPAKIWEASWSPDGQWIATAGWDGRIKIWEAKTGRDILTLEGHSRDKFISTIDWSPDSKRLASGGWGQVVKVWDIEKGCELFSMRGHTGLIISLDWSPNSSRIASSSKDQTIIIWDAMTGQELMTFRSDLDLLKSPSWSREGKCLAASCYNEGIIRLWDASIGYRMVSSPINSNPSETNTELLEDIRNDFESRLKLYEAGKSYQLGQ